MTTILDTTAHEGFLTEAQADHYIRVAQSAPYNLDTETYGTTPEADDALEKLTRAFLPLIHSVARTSKILEFEDALMTCLEEFVSVVRRYEVGSALPLKAGLRTILLRKLGDTGRTSGLIVVKENAAARYRQLMDRHDWDLEAAYAECRDTNNGFTPDTFMAVHNALGVDTLDVSKGTAFGRNDYSYMDGGTNNDAAAESALADPTPSPEDLTVQAETIRYLFAQVDPKAETILRLSYGFSDLATDNLRLAAGFRADGSPMSDRDVATVLGMRTPTVNRHRNIALATMRASLEDEDEVTTAA